MTEVFKEQLEALQEHCEDFKIASAIVHYDESSPHMHVVGVPVAHDFQKGMDVQVAKTRVFTKDSLSFLQDKMREELEQSLERHVPDLFQDERLKEKEKGRNKDIPKSSLDDFYKMEQVKEMYRREAERSFSEARESENKALEARKAIKDSRNELEALKSEIRADKGQVEQLDFLIQKKQSDLDKAKADFREADKALADVERMAMYREAQVKELELMIAELNAKPRFIEISKTLLPSELAYGRFKDDRSSLLIQVNGEQIPWDDLKNDVQKDVQGLIRGDYGEITFGYMGKGETIEISKASLKELIKHRDKSHSFAPELQKFLDKFDAIGKDIDINFRR